MHGENRYTYRVTSAFADARRWNRCVLPCPLPAVSFQLCSTGSLKVLSAASGGVTIAGACRPCHHFPRQKRAGAYTPQGTQVAVGSNADEQENSDGSADNNYVSHTLTSTFDDLVVWISPNILINRMVAAGKLP